MAPLPQVVVSPTGTAETASTNTSNSPSAPGHEIGVNPVPRSGESNIVPLASWIDGASTRAVYGGAGQSGSGGAMSSKLRREHWGLFVGGNLISVSVVAALISQLLLVCFDEYAGDDISDARKRLNGKDPEQATEHTKDTVLFTLVFGLMVDIFFAVVLSVLYRVPLDIKSVHHIPLEAMLSWGECFMVLFLAPFSWALIYLFGGTASRYLSLDFSCEAQGGSGLEFYLTISGMSMTIVGLILLGISMVGLCSSFGSPSRRSNGCRAGVNRVISEHLLSIGVVLDVFWQLQGVVWSYRTGGFQLVLALFVGMCSVIGALLPSIGILAPDKQDIVTAELNV